MKYPVLLPNIFDHPFTYESNLNLKIGEYVKVPFPCRFPFTNSPSYFFPSG